VVRKLIPGVVGFVAVLVVVVAMLVEPSGAVERSLTTAADGEAVTQGMRVKIQPDKVEEFEALMVQLVRDAANEPGVTVYEVRRVKGQPLTYVYFLSFEDQAAFARYSAADWHTQAAPKILACLDGNPVIEDLVSFY
jgi:quinol monooxygenase YgiN